MADDDPAIHAADEQHDHPVDLARFVRLARLVLEREEVPEDAEVSLLFVDATTIAEYNQRFLDVAGPTDVLSFPIDDDITLGRWPDSGGRGPGQGTEPAEPPTLLGDVMVCPSYAAAEARRRNLPVEAELELLVVHGLLHLLNYDHMEGDEAERMRRRERELLDAFRGVSATTNGASAATSTAPSDAGPDATTDGAR